MLQMIEQHYYDFFGIVKLALQHINNKGINKEILTTL